jgi:leucyl aminopeptidase
MPEVIASQDDIKQVSCSLLLVGATQSGDGADLSDDGAEVDRALHGQLTDFLRSQAFKADIGQLLVMPSPQIAPASVGVVGLGKRSDLDAAQLRKATGSAVRKLRKQRSIATTVHRSIAGSEAESAAVEGLLLGSYRFDGYKSQPSDQAAEQMALLGASQEGVRRGTVRATATKLARDLINEPSSTLNPATFAERAREVAEDSNLDCTVFEEDELAARGFGGLLAVGKGSDFPPRLIQLRYSPNTTGRPSQRIVLVGKGITFDSGGLSIKTIPQMEDMKTDMSGAAATLAAMSSLRDLDVFAEVTCIIPAAENMISGRSLRPGDVIHHYGGKTSEVLNTDAEGRLVLADALALASEQKPDAIVDIATLTGSIVVALGLHAAGLFCEDDSLRQELLSASATAGERFWWMPIFSDYRKQLDSDVADIKNVATRWGGAIFAANFLREFVDSAIPWGHLDIAGAARADEDRFEVTKGGTGYGTRTLISWLERRGGEG